MLIWTAPEGNLGQSTIVERVTRNDGHRLECSVPANSLAELVPASDLPSARLIKIDIEGAEQLAIEGIINIIGKF